MTEILDETEVAAMLDCAPTTVQELARQKKLPGVQFGRSWRFPRAALLEVVNRMRMLSVPECRRAMGFPDHYRLPERAKDAMHMLGNAVVPMVARDVINAIRNYA